MRVSRFPRIVAAGFDFLLSITLATSIVGHAEQLPIKTYTTADGLARDNINRIVRDSHGFLWFCTEEGLSRFDGYRFVNYTTDQGLPHRRITDLLETRNGVYWVATGDGVCRFNPIGQPTRVAEAGIPRYSTKSSQSNEPMFIAYHIGDDKSAQRANVLMEDQSGAVWCGTNHGVYRMDQNGSRLTFQFVDIGLPAQPGDDTFVDAMLEDRHGALWIGAGGGLYRRLPDGRVERYTTEHRLPSNFVQSLLEDHEGRLWVGLRFGGLCRIVADPDLSRSIVARSYTTSDGLPTNWIASLFQSSDGKVWVGTTGGLSELVSPIANAGQSFRSYTTAQGLSDQEVWAIAEDRDGSMWLGTENGGAMKIAWNGFTTYGTVDGLGSTHITSIFSGKSDALCVISSTATQKYINQFDGKRFTAAQLERINYSGWGWNQIAFQDHDGDWWVNTAEGLYRFPRAGNFGQLARARPKAFFESKDGIGSGEVFRLFEDSRGDIWISTLGSPEGSLTRWQRATRTFHSYPEFGQLQSGAPTAFREDGAGNLWIGAYSGGLARYRADSFTLFKEADGVPAGMIRSLYIDRRGRLWIAGSVGGLGRIDDLTAERPSIVTYTTAEGLSSNDVWCITEDQWGRIYAGTGRGLDRLDPDSGHIKHYTATDGLARGKVEEAFRDQQGALWFGTAEGLSRFLPEPDRPRSPPPIVISGLRVAGVTRRVSELGETAVERLRLGPSENQVEIDFVGLGFGAGEMLRYQYMLEGADPDWKALTDQRTVSYASLGPGDYRFVVRAVNADGLISPTPASVVFTILPPMWRQWWFLALASILVTLGVYAMHRYRVARLIDLERVRTRIATDLHDDIGSSLSRMAILSEVVKRQVGDSSRQSQPMLTEIADSARNLVDSMSDIVWAIDPRRDSLSNVVSRVRQFASDILEAKKIKLDFQVPSEFDRIKLSAEQRRHVFLIFKEALNNVARHADCSSVLLRINIAHHQLIAEVRDDGEGFVQDISTNGRGGHGLENMQRRASQLGGQFAIHSSPGQGTHLKLTVPLKKSVA